MYKKELVIAYLVLAVITVSVITYIFIQVSLPATITGAISAQGGYITGANISTESNSQHWASLFGEVNLNSGSNYTYSTTVAGGSTTELNLTLGCIGEELYASTSAVSDWSLITAGTTNLVDSYLQLSAGASESAASMFTTSGSYTVRNGLISVPQTYTLSQSSNLTIFDLGILNYSNAIVIVTTIVANKVGFDGRTHDYQLLLPTKEEQTTYYFFGDCATEEEEPPPGPGPGGGGGAIEAPIEVPVEVPVGVPIEELPSEKKLGEQKEKEEGKVEERGAEIGNETILEKAEKIPSPSLAGKAWGIIATKKFALYFFPLALMAAVMLILIILLFWVKKRQRKHNE